jgi:hypothetical protein
MRVAKGLEELHARSKGYSTSVGKLSLFFLLFLFSFLLFLLTLSRQLATHTRAIKTLLNQFVAYGSAAS